MQKNYTFTGSNGITIDISELDNSKTITLSGYFVGDTASKIYNNSEVATVTTVKTWTTAHELVIGGNTKIYARYSNGKLTLSTTAGTGGDSGAVGIFTVND